jgi:DNA-binding transcriptional MerR regulator
MDDDGSPLLTIGELARRTGLPVRTIRYWSDIGAEPRSWRSSGGHRLFDAESVARLELVRTLRELGLGLDEVPYVRERLRAGVDSQSDRYHKLLAVINGEQARPSRAGDLEWLIAAIDSHPSPPREIVGG